jgi:hypothetical protein
MTDRQFYFALTLVLLVLVGAEVAYAVYGPFSAPDWRDP